ILELNYVIGCFDNCSYPNGNCVNETCVCESDYYGVGCRLKLRNILFFFNLIIFILIFNKTKESCEDYCSDNGKCNSKGICVCEKGHSGIDCKGLGTTLQPSF